MCCWRLCSWQLQLWLCGMCLLPAGCLRHLKTCCFHLYLKVKSWFCCASCQLFACVQELGFFDAFKPLYSWDEASPNTSLNIALRAALAALTAASIYALFAYTPDAGEQALLWAGQQHGHMFGPCHACAFLQVPLGQAQ